MHLGKKHIATESEQSDLMEDLWSAAVFIVQSQAKGREVTGLYCLTAAEQRQASNLAVLPVCVSMDWIDRNPFASKASFIYAYQWYIILFL